MHPSRISLFLCVRMAAIILFIAFVMLSSPISIEPARAHPLGATAAEIASLTSLYNALGGPGWNHNTNWLVGDPCTDNWYGISCFNLHVQDVHLASNNLIGDIGAVDLTGLTSLSTLDLQYNHTTGNIGDLDLTQNTALFYLYLGDGIPRLTGNIGDLDLTHNVALRRFYLEGTDITGDIGDLDLTQNVNLEEIRMDGNNIGGNIEGLDVTNSPYLVNLLLGGNQIGGNIDGLDLTHNPRLSWLMLDGNQIGGNVDGLDLTQNSALTIIELEGNQIGGAIDGLNLTQNVALSELNLSVNNVGGNIEGLDITRNSALSDLNLCANTIGGAIEGLNLGANAALAELALCENQIWGDIAGLDLSANIFLTGLYLYDNQITGDPSHLVDAQYTALNDLRLFNNQLNGTIPDLTATNIPAGYLGVCGGANVVRPSGSATTDSFAETYDATGWTATGGCGQQLAVTAACNGTNLDVIVNSGDGPFAVAGTGPGLPQTGLAAGTTTLVGPGTWTGLTVAETTGDTEQLRLGDFTCLPPPITEAPAPITMPGGPATLDPAISKSGSPPNAKVDEQVTFTIVVSNPHNQAIDNVVVNDPVPQVFDVVNVSATRGSTSVSGQTVTVNIGTLQPGEQVTITIVVRGNTAAQAGRICNTATAGGAHAEGCVALMPGQLPATGGRPVEGIPTLWILVGAGGVIATGIGFWRRRIAQVPTA